MAFALPLRIALCLWFWHCLGLPCLALLPLCLLLLLLCCVVLFALPFYADFCLPSALLSALLSSLPSAVQFALPFAWPLLILLLFYHTILLLCDNALRPLYWYVITVLCYKKHPFTLPFALPSVLPCHLPCFPASAVQFALPFAWLLLILLLFDHTILLLYDNALRPLY